MCARYTLRAPPDPITELFGLTDVPRLDARYNTTWRRRNTSRSSAPSRTAAVG
jgi:hypothetical protein